MMAMDWGHILLVVLPRTVLGWVFLMAAIEGYVSLAKNSQDARMLQSGKRHVIRHLESLRPARGRMRAAARASPPLFGL